MPVVESEVTDSSVELLREFERTGRPEPFEAFMRRHASMVYATCLKVTRDPHDAEDATQATFLTLASKSRLNGGIRQPEAWLRKVAHRLALDLIRSKKRRVNRENLRSEMTSEEAPLDSHDHADKGEVKTILNEELAKLPASYRMPLILHYFGGLSRDEMADQLKLKPSTLGVRLHRAREQLRRKLAARGILLPAVALTALLTEVVRSSVCGHMMSSTAKQASAIAMGTAAAPTMFAATASGGFDSLGALLGMLAHGKLKMMLSAAVALTSAISLTNARVQEFLPLAVRDWLPTWRLPGFGVPTLPKLQMKSPMPTLFAAHYETADVAQTMTLPEQGASSGYRIPPTEAPPSVATFALADVPSVADGAVLARIGPTLRTMATESSAMVTRPVSMYAFYTLPTTINRPITTITPPTFYVPTPAPRPSPAPSDDVSTPTRQPIAPTQSSDPWNNVIPIDDDDVSPAGPAIAPTMVASSNDAAVPERVVAAVTGAAPALAVSRSESSGTNNAGVSSGGVLPQTAASTRRSTRTAVFSGTSANYGGYSDASWKPTQLADLSGSLQSLDNNSTLDNYNGPGIPGETLSINGARVTLHQVAETGDITVSFVDTSVTYLPTLPQGHHFIGVWELDVHDPFESADLLVRYDDLRAARLGLNEQMLKLWVSDGIDWSLLWLDPSFGRDVTQNLLWVTADQDFRFFAVSAPEPGSLLAVLGIAGVISRRRRTR